MSLHENPFERAGFFMDPASDTLMLQPLRRTACTVVRTAAVSCYKANTRTVEELSLETYSHRAITEETKNKKAVTNN